MNCSSRTILASIVTPVIFGLLLSWGLRGESFVNSFVSMFVGVVLIGLPVYLHLKKQKGIYLAPILFGTFVMGVFAGVLLNLIGGVENMSIGGTVLIENGSYTLNGVRQVFTSSMGWGLLGALTGLVWWFMAKFRFRSGD